MADKIVAYLIIAHHQPEQLRDMVAQLQSDEVSFFVHIDKKADITPFRAGVSQYDNVFFVEERVPADWGTFGLVRATLSLLGAATESQHQFQYCVLLSGVCYPIKSNEHLLRFFKSSEHDFIAHVPERSDFPYHKYRAVLGRLIDFVYELRAVQWLRQRKHAHAPQQQLAAQPAERKLSGGTPAPTPRGAARRRWNLLAALVGKALAAREYYHDMKTHDVDTIHWYFVKHSLSGGSHSKIVARALGIAEFLLNLILPAKKPPARLRPHAGSQWWYLRHATATALYRFLTDKKNRDIVNFYRYSRCSDERIFHSVIGSGLLGTTARPAPAPTQYIRHQLSATGRPVALTLADLADIQHSSALFARKIDYVASAELKRELLKSIGGDS